MSRWLWFWTCAILGLVMLFCGWLVPMHLRAVDVRIVQQTGRNTPALSTAGLALVNERKLQAAQFLLQAGRQEHLSDWEELALAVNHLAKEGPTAEDAARAEVLGPDSPKEPFDQPITDVVIRLGNRERALDTLAKSPNPAVQELLRCRVLTNNVLFPPASSSSGQAFDAALSICGLLLDQGQFSAPLSNSVFAFSAQARLNPQPLEETLMSLMSLGQRLNWGELAVFVSRIPEPETLRVLARQARQAGDKLPVLFSAVVVSGNPSQIATYLANYSQSGLADLGTSLRYGAGGLNELMRRDQRLYTDRTSERVAGKQPLRALSDLAVGLAKQAPGQALAFKWLLYLAGGFLLAAGIRFVRRPVSALERPLQVPGLHFARELLFALGFLLVVLLLSEPFLAQESQKVDFPFRLRLPMVGGAVPAGIANIKPSIMNQLSLLTLLLFFVLQALLYTACLVKLAEIRRQRVPARIKLRLLENEDHLFDAGLYLGFVGTIISLILVSLGVIKPSLMAAYSSTSFGIIFVSIFKIFHVRPYRRKVLLEAEAAAPQPAAPVGQPAFATSP